MKPTLVSCLCVTENRLPFLPWLVWGFRRQTWSRRELVIVSGSPVPPEIADTPDVRVVRVPPGCSIPAKRNTALDAAAGDILAWFDDDDWQHPQRLERLVEALQGGCAFAGTTSAWFVDLERRRCASYRRGARVLFNGAGFRTDAARAARFDPSVARASDTKWLRELTSQVRGQWSALPGDDAFFWLCHESNISNPARRRRFPVPLENLRNRIGSAWLDTDEQLDALRERLAEQHRLRPGATANGEGPVRGNSTATKGTTAKESPSIVLLAPHGSDGGKVQLAAATRPPVAAVVKATVLDVPFLRVTVPHLLRQAGLRFEERLLVLDRPPSFSGKYRERSRGSEVDLDRVAAELLDNGVIDRVITVDDSTESRAAILERYFGDEGARVPTHATTGGPIYATLFGIEAASVDHVVQFDADMLFHSSGGSWVEAGLRVLGDDPTVWLVMTHAGPPAGSMGTPQSLGRRNARLARWDPALGVWRFATASTRYFLTDRRRLHGKLAPVAMRGGCAPLEVCLGAALRRYGASRVGLAQEGSWDLHPTSHEPPFPDWVAALAAAVERGDVPAGQRGHYDLRLERSQDRARWRKLIAVGDDPPARAASLRSPEVEQTARPRPPDRGVVAPLTVVIPVRDRAGLRLCRCLESLSWQSAGRPLQTLVVSQGSQPHIDAELGTICRDAGATLIRIGQPTDPWRKPLALNVGLRASDPALAFVMTLDADMILAPDFLETVLHVLREQPRRLVLCRSSDLPRAPLPEPEALLAAYPRLRAGAKLRGRHGTGGIQAAARAFFFEVQGYDEDLVWWGAEDGDMVRRASLAGLEQVWICDRTSMLHQWHPHRFNALGDPRMRREAAVAWRRNHRLVDERAGQIVRNTDDWGRSRG